MSFIQWSPSLSTTVDEMDNQHKQLITLINQLHDAMTSGKGKETVSATLTALANYTKQHFGAEEQYMQKIGYPELAKHKKIHQDLVNQVMELSQKINAGETIAPIQVMNFLRDWLKNHIQQEDKKYGEWAAKKTGAAVAAR